MIYRLHEETAAVEHASEKLETKTTLAPVRAQAQSQATQSKGLRQYRASVLNDPQKKQVDDSLTGMSEQVDAWIAEEQEMTGMLPEQEAESRASR